MRCSVCGKQPLDKSEVGACKKLIAEDTQQFYCLQCLASYLEVEPEDIREKIEEFKDEGCLLFQ